MPFLSGPELRYAGCGQYETVGATDYRGAHDHIAVPAGFATDLATVPRAFWAVLPPHGAYEKAAVLHDWLCVQLAAHRRCWCRPPVNARETDGLFRRVMREAGVGPVTRWVMWTGVRWGALANPARRAGWWRDAPAVAGITAAGLAAAVTAVRVADRAARLIARSSRA
ncbi:DUF1353 domain-containing protein [Blastococcus xanthinilyticus]|uniref:Uncharacterized protein DUF1353 n=1 Tax=Blastococcus xanthinilyticus TaxID=1564164 RepID=A0A5S5CLL7_9ACTN|nr:DUF1353 domain-containing protein [Blastococcus xanthinilyticus]TYP82084.1 uncharacterized protein DUF1353 [Blastococcus xanthinilyticus]